MAAELEAPNHIYPWTRLYSQDYNTILWDSDTGTGSAEEFLAASEYDWLGIVRDHNSGWRSRWSGRLVKHETGIQAIPNFEFLEHILTWPSVDDYLT